MLFCVLTMLFPISACLAQQLDNSVTSVQVPNNTTAVIIAPGSHRVVSIEVFNNSTSVAYLKLYDAATQTCGSGTPKARYLIGGSTNGLAGPPGVPLSDLYINGIAACVTTGFADSDTTAPAASQFIYNIHWR